MLVGQSNELLRVIAANQSLLKITPCIQHGNHFDLMRAAYHLGNRHVSLELRPDVILIETDSVLKDMLQRMHLDVEEIDAPFEPESGAYNSVSHSEHHHGHHHHPHGHG